MVGWRIWPVSHEQSTGSGRRGRPGLDTIDSNFLTRPLIRVLIIAVMEEVKGGKACVKRSWASRAAVREDSRREQQFYRSVCPLVSLDSIAVLR